jgi:predicted nucleotidyltransferase
VDLAHPLSLVADSTTTRVLEVLAGTTRPLTGREVHRIAGRTSVATVWRTLQRLGKQGLVDVNERGNATYYVANREHLAWPAVETLVRLRSAFIDRLTQQIKAWPVQPLHASLFGSTARGDSKSDSDVDILVVTDNDMSPDDQTVWANQVSTLRDDVAQWTGNAGQVFDIDLNRLHEHRSADDPLVDAWVREGIILAGAPLPEVLGRIGEV